MFNLFPRIRRDFGRFPEFSVNLFSFIFFFCNFLPLRICSSFHFYQMWKLQYWICMDTIPLDCTDSVCWSFHSSSCAFVRRQPWFDRCSVESLCVRSEFLIAFSFDSWRSLVNFHWKRFCCDCSLLIIFLLFRVMTAPPLFPMFQRFLFNSDPNAFLLGEDAWYFKSSILQTPASLDCYLCHNCWMGTVWISPKQVTVKYNFDVARLGVRACSYSSYVESSRHAM